jgi:hypothetical protein
MEDEIKRWAAKRKTALVLDMVQGKNTEAEASRHFALPPTEVEVWFVEGKRDMENALRTNLLAVKEHYQRKLRVLQEADGEVMLELNARNKVASLLGSEGEGPVRISVCEAH